MSRRTLNGVDVIALLEDIPSGPELETSVYECSEEEDGSESSYNDTGMLHVPDKNASDVEQSSDSDSDCSEDNVPLASTALSKIFLPYLSIPSMKQSITPTKKKC